MLSFWLKELTALCKPSHVHFCDGSKEEFNALAKLLVDKGTFVPLNPQLRPDSFWARSNAADVARVEEATCICTPTQEEAGPNNKWCAPDQMRAKLKALFSGAMKGRVLYVIPFCMGPLNSSRACFGVEFTDSPYVVCNMHLMTRMGKEVLEKMGDAPFVPCVHSVGCPLDEGEKDSFWPCRPNQLCIAHFPKEREVWSFGSGYGGNALLGKKSLALRIASYLAKEEGWLAEHMLIIAITNPEGKKRYFTGAFPSACGKTNLALLSSSLPGWKIECVGDDIAWLYIARDGTLRAINPETGFFGVAPGTSLQSNPNAMKTIEKNTLFTNVALTPERDVWWEGMTEKVPPHLTSWRNLPWTPQDQEPAAHPNARFTVSITQCPILDSRWSDPEGVPISAIIFGGRRRALEPLVYEAFSWPHGVLLGATLSSEMTAAAKGTRGQLRHDPFAMLPFCGYHMGDYFQHWLNVGKKIAPPALPKIFRVNWFRKGKNGAFLWPGFKENVRVLKWIFERMESAENGTHSPLGIFPKELDLSNLKLSQENYAELFSVNREEWLKEIAETKSYFLQFGSHFPKELDAELSALKERIHKHPEKSVSDGVVSH